MLRDRQLEFMNAVLTPATQGTTFTMPNIRQNAHSLLMPAERIAVYRRNIMTTLRGALGDIFPTAKSIMGQKKFWAAADLFIQLTPSPSGDLNQFGREWPDFLNDYVQSSPSPGLPAYLHDMAKLDWAWHEAFHTADRAPLDLARLATVPVELHAALVFSLHPSAHLFDSMHPLYQLWQAHQPEVSNNGHEQEAMVHEQSTRDFLLVHRGESDVTLTRLSEAQYRFLSACFQQQRLAEACDAAFQIDEAFSLQEFLIQAVQQNIIVDFASTLSDTQSG